MDQMITEMFSSSKIYEAPAGAGMESDVLQCTLQVGKWIDWNSHFACLVIKLIKERRNVRTRWLHYHSGNKSCINVWFRSKAESQEGSMKEKWDV